ncbi:amidohydrolase [Dyadobacter tibetensis]|uniref:amidohydrolase n=1 Tax=Dyadobacter tibetensis TaxID=1211851 RepID=UPI000472B92A|nr:amidohydrolase [Dyadobacter tibetensis]
MKSIPFLNWTLFLGLTLNLACNSKQKADLIVHHAMLYTVDSVFTTAEAMAIRDGKVIAIGSNDEILKNYESQETVDAEGKAILPGFIDAHCHFTGYATDMWKCELTGTTSYEEVLQKMKAYSQSAPMEWLFGRGWDQNDWENKSFPTKRELDEMFPDRPVFLTRIDGHAALANQVALDRAGITAATQIVGGRIELKNGKPTGLLIDNAMGLVEIHIPPLSDSLTTAYYLKAQEYCFQQGLTGVHDCGVSEHTVELVDASQKAGKLKMKVFALLNDTKDYYERWIKKGPYKTDLLHVGGFKVYADGALGSRGASLLHDYSDKSGWKGFLLSNPAHFDSLAQMLVKSNLQMCTHAIGDSGNRQILKAYAKVLKPGNDRRWRIEHAQVVNENDFHFFKDYNIIPSVQPTHATSDMYWAEDRLGTERVKGAYAFKRLLGANGWIPLGTDFPVEYISPFKTFYAATARQDAAGFPAGGFQYDQALSREETLRGMTIWAAKAAFEEKEKGSLEVGKSADFILLDTNPMEAELRQVLSTKVLATYINGEKVFGR